MSPEQKVTINIAYVPTRWGKILLAEKDGKLVATSLPGTQRRLWEPRLVKMFGSNIEIVEHETPVLTKAVDWFNRYFNGKNPGSPPPIKLIGTPFQQKVWEALTVVAWGKTSSYGRIALAVMHPRAVRAVGQACKVNPLAIMVPCHRILRSDGGISNFAGGRKMKHDLLALEGVDIPLKEKAESEQPS